MSTVIAREVEIYTIFCKLDSVNTVQGKFEGEIDIVTAWFDDIHENYNPEQHWNPQLVFDNLVEKDAKIQVRVETKFENNSLRIVQYQKIIGTFTEWLNVKQFPFDVQRIGIIVASLHPTTRIKLIVKQEYCYLSQKTIHINDSWDLNENIFINYSTYQEHTPYLRSQQYPRIKFNILIARKSQFYITNLIIPLFLVTSTIFISFTHDVASINPRLGICATTLLTSINFRFIIHNYLPNVPYSTYLDYYSIISILSIIFVFVWQACSPKQFHQLTYEQLDNYVSITFAIIYILIHIFFIIFAWIIPKRRQKKFLKTVPTSVSNIDDDQPIQLDNLLGYERSINKITVD